MGSAHIQKCCRKIHKHPLNTCPSSLSDFTWTVRVCLEISTLISSANIVPTWQSFEAHQQGCIAEHCSACQTCLPPGRPEWVQGWKGWSSGWCSLYRWDLYLHNNFPRLRNLWAVPLLGGACLSSMTAYGNDKSVFPFVCHESSQLDWVALVILRRSAWEIYSKPWKFINRWALHCTLPHSFEVLLCLHWYMYVSLDTQKTNTVTSLSMHFGGPKWTSFQSRHTKMNFVKYTCYRKHITALMKSFQKLQRRLQFI